MTQKILKKEVALSGSEQNPDFASKSWLKVINSGCSTSRPRRRWRLSSGMAKTSLLPVPWRTWSRG
jgi:predicted oxidoreductase